MIVVLLVPNNKAYQFLFLKLLYKTMEKYKEFVRVCPGVTETFMVVLNSLLA